MLFDIVGKKVGSFGWKRLVQGRNELNLDISDMLPGIYFCKIKVLDSVITERIVVK